MNKITLIIFIITSLNLFAKNEWEETYILQGTPQKISCVDSNNIYSITTQNQPNRLYKSSDQAKKWELINDKFPDAESMVDMSTPDIMNIFIVCLLNKGIIYKSSDGGKTFELIQLSGINYFRPTITMYNKDIGVVGGGKYITTNGWLSFDIFEIDNLNRKFTFANPVFINDSILYSLAYVYDISIIKTGIYKQSALLKLNIYSKEYEINPITNVGAISEFCRVNDKLFFSCGQSNTISGGSGNDAIYKSSDSGKTWRRVLDLYSDETKFLGHYFPPFGLQSIAFRDSLTGITVGQFGKILYTYDGGESWVYEKDLPQTVKENTPATMIVRYAGSVPILATYSGRMYRLLKDDLTPKSEDTITISGRVWEGNKGQPGIPVILGYRVTMTDSNGYYKFTRLPKGKHIVKAINKYFDGPKHDMGYKPFDYTPIQYDLDLTSDTSGIDFNAIDLRTFYSVSGEIVTSGGKGLKDIPLTIGDSTTISTADGKFLFPKIEQKRTYEMIPYSKEYKFTPWAYSINIDKDIDTFRFVAIPITSVEENPEVKGRIGISPNPANNFITIDLERCATLQKCGTSTVEIYDVMGLLLHTDTIHPMTPSHRMNIENLSPGVYFVKVNCNNGACSIVEKFVKY